MAETDQPYVKMLDDFRASGDSADWIAGGRFSGSTIGMATPAMDMRALGLDMPVPFFIFQGRDDHITGAEPARAYAADIRAPAKGYVALDGGHYACFTSTDQFLGAMRTHVLPLV
jgi:pimeloyl-ACP methyl ester carboxylesterase